MHNEPVGVANANRSMVTLADVSYLAFRDGKAIPVISNVSLDILENDFLTIVGSNGSGKTTLLRVISGDITTTTDDGDLIGLRKLGEGFRNDPSPSQSIGMLRQQAQLFPWMTVKENVAFGPTVRGKSTKECNRIFDRLNEKLRIGHLAKRYPHRISGGERQKVALAQVLAIEPKLLLLDEPFSALDPNTRSELRAVVSYLHEMEKLSIIHVTHDISEAVTMARRVVVISPQLTSPSEPGGSKGSTIITQVSVQQTSAFSALDIARAENAIAALFLRNEELKIDKQQALDEERSLEAGGVVYVAAIEVEREYEHPEQNPFFPIICENLKRGVSYRYFFPDYVGRVGAGRSSTQGEHSMQWNLRQMISALLDATGLGESILKERVRVFLAPRHLISQLSGDCVVIEREVGHQSGWYFPIPFDYDFIFRLSGERLTETSSLLSSWHNGTDALQVFPETIGSSDGITK